MIIAITGATGFVGQAVLDEAGRRGQLVKALTRGEQASHEGVEWVRGDLHDHAALARLAEGTEAVLHIAGVVNAADEAGFLHANVEGTQNVVAAARDGGAGRFVCVSSLAAREPGLSDYGRSKRLAEEAVQVSGLDWTIVRPPAIYGPRDTEMFEMFRAARTGILPMPARGCASVIHVDDLSRLLIELARGSGETTQRIFEPDDGRLGGWQHGELARAIGEAMGRKVWVPRMSPRLLQLAARGDRLLRGNKAKLTADRASYMSHPDWVCASARHPPALLWTAQIDTREGLADTARWYREQGWL